MAINYTTLMRAPKPDAGTQTWATQMHRLADIFDRFTGAIATVTQVGGSVTLADADGTADVAKSLVIRSAQVLTSNLTVVVPTRARLYLIDNSSSGAFTMTVKTAAGSGVVVKQGRQQWVRCDGTNVVAVSRLSGLITSTEVGTDIITASNGALKDNAVVTAKIAANAVTLAKLAGGGSFGRILYTATGAGFPWATLVRGVGGQELAMSTSANPLPIWRNSVFRQKATSTGIAFSYNATMTFTHGLSITNKYDIHVRCVLECISPDANFAIGDCIQINDTESSGGGATSIIVDSLTQVKLLTDEGITVRNKTSTVSATLTAANWVARFTVYA